MLQWLAPMLAVLCVSCNNEDPSKSTNDGKSELGLTEAQADETLVKIGDRNVTVGEFADQLASMSPYLRARFDSPERKKEFLESFIRFELLVAEAERLGYDKEPTIVRAKRDALVQAYLKQEIDQKLSLSSISNEQVQAYYDAHPEEFRRPAQVSAGHIQLRDKAKALALLKDLKEKNDLEYFRQVAKNNSEDNATRDSGGDLKFFDEQGDGAPHAAIRKAAFSMKSAAEVYPKLVKTPAGYHIVTLVNKRQRFDRSLDQAQRSIRHRLLRDKKAQERQALLERLKKEVSVSIDYAALDNIKLESEPTKKAK